ncbi:Lariat debranching enzyme [Apiospora hydei]|uniref:Lariat debranching enzyme n=1 Tax=Apiospora hydei TaxID=1337664 RepID=A0ABR1XE19_9PEZI
MASAKNLQEIGGVRVAFEGCGHGTLDAIYAAVQNAASVRGWDKVDLLIIGGDFQAVRNVADITVMSVPTKYRHLGDFLKYYRGTVKAPVTTLFIGGNHEAASHLWELYYGGWVAPNIYYMGAANVLRFGPLRIAGMSGIWKGFDYNRPHIERLPFNSDDIKSFYHVREIDVRKLLLVREQVDLGVSHDWPRAIERHGDDAALFREKPFFANESRDGTLGSPAATYVLDRLRPAYWLSAHLHCKFTAIKTFDAPTAEDTTTATEAQPATAESSAAAATATEPAANPDEIDLDMDDDEDSAEPPKPQTEDSKPEPQAAKPSDTTATTATSTVSDELRAQLPAAFARPTHKPKTIPGQPVPPTITNTETRFIALDKVLPGRKFLQLSYLTPVNLPDSAAASKETTTPDSQPKLMYDPEWLAITRVFHRHLAFGHEDRETARLPPDEGEAVYAPLIDAERAWVEEHVVKPGKLDVPDNFEITAPPLPEDEEVPDLNFANTQPQEYTSPQTAALCSLLDLPNLWDATAKERNERRHKGPARAEDQARPPRTYHARLGNDACATYESGCC